jgi:hypothetical protein
MPESQHSTKKWAALGLGLLLLIPAEVAQAGRTRTLCCVNAQGRNVCGDILPTECYGRAYREISERGITVRQIEAPLTPEQRAQRELDLERKKKEEVLAREEKRRNEALLNAYASEADIDFMRDRALEPLSNAMKETVAKQLEAQQDKKRLESELEFYKKKPVPLKLKERIKTNEGDIEALSVMIETKKQEMERITTRFTEEKRRFNQLTQGSLKTPAAKPQR